MAGRVVPARYQPVHGARSARGGGSVLQPDDVSLPVGGGAAHRQHLRVHGRRCKRPLLAPAWQGRVRAHWFRCFRNTLGKLCAEGRHQPQRPHPEEHRKLHSHAEALRGDVRLEPRGQHHGYELLQVDPVGVSEALRRGSGGTARGARELVPVLHDRAGQRAGHPGRMRALRISRGAAAVTTVVLPHYRLCASVARQHR